MSIVLGIVDSLPFQMRAKPDAPETVGKQWSRPMKTKLMRTLVSTLALAGLAGACGARAQITANPIPAPIEKRGLAVEIRDVARLPETRNLRPLDQDVTPTGWARVSFVRDLPDGRRFANDSRGFLYLIEGAKVALYADVAAAFPTDEGLTFFAVMPAKDHLPEFKADPLTALIEYFERAPEAPSLRSATPTEEGIVGKIDMTNRVRGPVAPGLALVGDAALATDPLFGVGCGWAFQSGEWLSDAVVPALRGEEPLDRGLKRYRKRHARQLRGHAYLIHDQADGRKLQPPERLLFAGAARDPKVATAFDDFATRQIGPARMFARTIPRSILVNARHGVGRRRGAAPAERRVAAG